VSDVARLAALIRERGPCVVLTGAGVSTESGIPDFRSATGLWAQFDPYDYGSIESFRENPARIWEFYGPRLGMLADAEPNPAHRALVELEQLGFVEAVVTQNIDRLHERAGSRSLVEVHGSIRTSSCLRCGEVYPLERVLELLPVPRCAECETVLKPDVVMFGELLPEAAIERAFALARGTGLMLAVGSSLEVYPVARLPLETLDTGGAFAIVNKGLTGLDSRAGLRLDASAGETLSAVAEELR
jgi:NAD-dependent deacetylase